VLQRETRRTQPPVERIESPAADSLLRAGRHGELSLESPDNRRELKWHPVGCLQSPGRCLRRSGRADHDGET